MTRMLNPRYIRNIIFNMRSNRYLDPILQILRLPRRKTYMLYPHHIWNLIFITRNNRCHNPNSPNITPATKNDTPKFQRKSSKTGATSLIMRERAGNNPSIKRSIHNPPRNWGYFSNSLRAYITFHTQAFMQKNTNSCTCHEKWHLNVTKCWTCHEKRRLNFTKYCTCHEK